MFGKKVVLILFLLWSFSLCTAIIFILYGCGKPAIVVIAPEELIINPSDRCSQWIQQVRTEHIKYFGFQFPYWYSVSQLAVESACRVDITAADSGQGIAQFMPKTVQYVQSLMGEALDPYNPKQAIRMQAFYMNRIHEKENWDGALFVSFQIYNGGRTYLYKEYQRAGITDWDLMKLECKRNKIQYSWGILDLCLVNYLYSKKIYKGGEKYRRGDDGIEFW